MRRALVSALAVPVLLLSACGSDDDGAEVVEPNGQTTEETTDDAAEETDDTVVEETTEDDAEETTDDAVIGGEDDAEATTEDGIGATEGDDAEETDGDDTAGGEPAAGDEQAAADRTKEWFVAFVSGDEAVCDMMLDFLGDNTTPLKDNQANHDMCTNMIPGMVGDMFTPEMVSIIESMEINGATIEGDTATVGKENFSDMFAEGFGDTQIKLQNIDGEWYVDMNSLSGM